MALNARLHLLLAITADGKPLMMVDSAYQLSLSTGATWSVVAIDTPSVAQRAPALRSALLQALDKAQSLGARVTRISTGSHTRSAVVSSLAHRALSEGATALMIGRLRQPGSDWPPVDQDLGAFADVLAQLLPGVTVHLVCLPQEAPDSPASSLRERWGFRGRRDSGRRGHWYGFAAGPSVLLALAVSTALGFALERYLDPANVIMLYLAGVVYVASRAGRAPAIATVLGGVLLYDLIFVHPRWSLKPTEPQYWLAFLVMLVVGLVISQLAAQTREQSVLAEARAQRTQALNQLSVALGRARDRGAVVQLLCAAVQSCVGVWPSLLFVADSRAQMLPGQELPAGFNPRWALEAVAGPREVGSGTALGSDEPLRYLPLVAGDWAFGVLVFSPPGPERDTLEDQHLVRALANQAAIALERADLERRSTAAAVEAEGERTRNTLLAGISHDFRTPLTTIVGNATMLIEQAAAIGEERRIALLQTLLAEAHRLHIMTSNLLDLTRLDEGAVRPRLEWCPADELLEAARSQMHTRLCHHRLVSKVQPEALVWCDARLVDQVLVNLLDNAIRHSPTGGVIRVAIEVGPGRWRLTVHDSGPGIPAGHEQAIFQKFYRAAGESDSLGKGLGLAICAAIAALHGGTITAHNDGGAKFTLTIPQPAPPELEQDETS